MKANISSGPIWPIIFSSFIAISAPIDATADLVPPAELSTHTQDVVLLADGPFVIDPEGHYLNVHSLTRPSSEGLGSTNLPQHTGGNRSGGASAASAGSGGGQGGTDAEQQGLATRSEPPRATLPFPTVIAGHEIPQTWATEPRAEADGLVPQIPIPSAAVLFGSALLGLIGFRVQASRKRS